MSSSAVVDNRSDPKAPQSPGDEAQGEEVSPESIEKGKPGKATDVLPHPEPPWWVFAALVAVATILVVRFGLADPRLIFVELLLALAAFAGGTLIGFLFGIPRTRSSADTRGDNESAQSADKFSLDRYQPGTSLEQIADWLTKIIIGVSLVEVRSIGDALETLGARVAKSTSATVAGTDVLTQLLFVVFVITGFLASYLWTRIHYGEIQAAADENVWTTLGRFFERKLAAQAAKTQSLEHKTDVIERVAKATASGRTAVSKDATKKEAKDVEQAITELTAGDSQIPPGQQLLLPPVISDVKGRLERFRKAEPAWDDDTVAEIFEDLGPQANGRRLDAEIEGRLGDSLLLTLSVRRVSGPPMRGSVLFLLHPTFRRRVISVRPKGDVARTEIVADEWFTVGAVADDGNTVLTLDLRQLRGAPAWFTKA